MYQCYSIKEIYSLIISNNSELPHLFFNRDSLYSFWLAAPIDLPLSIHLFRFFTCWWLSAYQVLISFLVALVLLLLHALLCFLFIIFLIILIFIILLFHLCLILHLLIQHFHIRSHFRYWVLIDFHGFLETSIFKALITATHDSLHLLGLFRLRVYFLHISYNFMANYLRCLF